MIFLVLVGVRMLVNQIKKGSGTGTDFNVPENLFSNPKVIKLLK